MAFSDRFTEKEWEALAGLPRLVATAAGYAAGYRPLESLREQFAGAAALRAAVFEFPDLPLIQEIASERAVETGDRPDPSAVSIETLGGVHQAVAVSLAQAEAANRALTRVDPETAAAYRACITRVAERVINIVKHGAILGVGGAKVDPAEADYLSRLRVSLGLDPAPSDNAAPAPPIGVSEAPES